MKKILLCILTALLLSLCTFGFIGLPPLIGKVAAVDGGGSTIQLVKSANATTIYSGDDVQYTLTVTNIGNQTLYNVTVTDDTLDFILDPVSFSPTLAPGEFNTSLINVTIIGEGTLTNTATARAKTLAGINMTDTDNVTVTVLAPVPIIESCDSAGVRKDTFSVGEDVYVDGTGFGNYTLYSLYVVEDQIWSNNMTIPARVPGTATWVMSEPDGTILPILAWADPLVPGKYDIVVDVNNNTKYDAGIDALDDNDIEVTAGFFVIPELPLGTILAALSMFVALIGYVSFKRHQTK